MKTRSNPFHEVTEDFRDDGKMEKCKIRSQMVTECLKITKSAEKKNKNKTLSVSKKSIQMYSLDKERSAN